MANIAIAGDTSGSVTLQAPAVAGGTVVTLPSASGTAALTSDLLGVGQTWQNVIGSRTAGLTYTNNTGKPIVMAISASATNYIVINFIINGVTIFTHNSGGGGYSQIGGAQIIVPNGATYGITISAGGLNSWFELR